MATVDQCFSSITKESNRRDNCSYPFLFMFFHASWDFYLSFSIQKKKKKKIKILYIFLISKLKETEEVPLKFYSPK